MAEQTVAQIRRETKRLKKLAGTYTHLGQIKVDLETYKNNIINSQQEAKGVIGSIKAIQLDSQGQIETIRQIANEINAMKESVEQTRTQVEQKRDSIVSLETKVSEQSDKLITNEQKYTEINAQVVELKEEVKKQLAVATAGTLAGSFSSRQKDLKFNSKLWLIFFMISAAILVIAGYTVIEQVIHANLLNSPISLVRVLVTVPLFYIVKFCADGYRKERSLEEEYAFKSSVSLSLAGYQKLLKDELPDGSNQQVIDFITRSVSSIYTPPRKENNKKSKEKKDFMDEVIELIKQIKK